MIVLKNTNIGPMFRRMHAMKRVQDKRVFRIHNRNYQNCSCKLDRNEFVKFLDYLKGIWISEF